MLHTLDSKVVALHQWVVNTTQKKPRWLMEQCCYGYMLFGVSGNLSSPEKNWGHYLSILVVLVFGTVLVFISRSEAAVQILKPVNLYRLSTLCIILPFNGFRLASLFLNGELPMHSWVMFPTDAFYLGCLYYPACDDPKPREPRRKLSMSGV